MIDVRKPPRFMGTALKATGRFHLFQGHSWKSRLWDIEFPNIATLLGLSSMQNVNYRGTTPITAWYIGVISATGYSTPLSSDTISSKPWTEWTDYSGNRPQWSPDAAVNGVLTNSTYATLTPSASTAIQGLFIVSDNTRGGTTGLLDATGVLASSRTVTSGTPLQLRYTKTLAPG